MGSRFFDLYIKSYDINQMNNEKFLFFMTISYFGFLRISELLYFLTKDVIIDSKNNRLKALLKFSKTNQTGDGSTICVCDNDKQYSPL